MKSLIAVILSGGLGAAALLAGGCMGYSNYPAVDSSYGLTENPNGPSAEGAMVTAVRWVADRYPPGESDRIYGVPESGGLGTPEYSFVINGPIGLRKATYERMARRIGPNVLPITPELAEGDLPIFHISRVWVRGQSATVDVLRPATQISPGDDGQPVYQMVTVYLSGGLRPWKVDYGRVWEPGVERVPPYYFLPEVDYVDQYQRSLAEVRATAETLPPQPVPGEPAQPPAAGEPEPALPEEPAPVDLPPGDPGDAPVDLPDGR